MGLPKLDEEKLKQASLKDELILRRADLFARAVIRSMRLLMLMAFVVGWVENYETTLQIYSAMMVLLTVVLFGLMWWASPKRLSAIKCLDTRSEGHRANQHEDAEIDQ